jgi:hypothetical protein
MSNLTILFFWILLIPYIIIIITCVNNDLYKQQQYIIMQQYIKIQQSIQIKQSKKIEDTCDILLDLYNYSILI